MKAEFAAEKRRDSARKTTEALHRKARLGHVIGDRRFGYRYITVGQHGDLVIDKDERLVVAQIFDLRAWGRGYTAIAKTLNNEGARTPRPQQGRPACWSASTVRPVPLSRGLGHLQDEEAGRVGRHRAVASAVVHWVRVQRDDLRIVSDEQRGGAHADSAQSGDADHRGQRAVVRRDYDSKYPADWVRPVREVWRIDQRRQPIAWPAAGLLLRGVWRTGSAAAKVHRGSGAAPSAE